MRRDLVSPGVGEMTYEIRNIVNVAEKLQKCGVKINWENIGDPIVKGEQIQEPSLPASFRVLVKELQSLGLAVEAVMDTGDEIRFGKDEERARPVKMGTGLLSIGGDLEDELPIGLL